MLVKPALAKGTLERQSFSNQWGGPTWRAFFSFYELLLLYT